MSRAHYRNQLGGFLGDVKSGCLVGLGHFKWLVTKTLAPLVGYSESDESLRQDFSNEGLKVIGVGYGRTGTYSLGLALDELGYPTLHTQHLYETGEIFDHLVDNIFLKSIEENRVVEAEPDFDLLLKGGYVATVDLPFALYFEQIRDQYPDCKFVLTTREDSETWFRSWNVMTSSITQPAQYASSLFTHVKKLEYYMRYLFATVNDDKEFLTSPWPLPPQNKEKAIASYEKHNQLVRDTIPPSHLLEYNVRQGWGPLCKFLEVGDASCPTTPFPKSNSARAVKWQSYSSFIGPPILASLIMLIVFSGSLRRIRSAVDWFCHQRSRILQLVSKGKGKDS